MSVHYLILTRSTGMEAPKKLRVALAEKDARRIAQEQADELGQAVQVKRIDGDHVFFVTAVEPKT